MPRKKISNKNIPELEKKQFEQWAQEIIKKYSLTDKATLENITQQVAVFFDDLFEDYQISFTDLHPDGIFPFAIENSKKKPGYADEQFFDELFKVENHIHWTYVSVLTKLYKTRQCPYNLAECPY